MAGQFVAVGHDGIRITSKNGVDWSEPLLGKEGETLHAIAAGGGRHVAIGRFGYDRLWATSPDGVTWQTEKSESKGNRYMLGLTHAQEKFVAVGGQAEILMKDAADIFLSVDGQKWEQPPSIGGITVLRRLAFGAGRFVAVGDRGRRSWSEDGRTWSDFPKPPARETMVEIAFGGGRFVGVGLHGLRMSTPNGETWSEPLIGEEGEHLNSIVWNGQQFVAVGAGATYFSPDGLAWERKPNQDAPLTCAWGEGSYVGTNWRGRIMHSTDGVNWKQVFKAPQHLEAITFG